MIELIIITLLTILVSYLFIEYGKPTLYVIYTILYFILVNTSLIASFIVIIAIIVMTIYISASQWLASTFYKRGDKIV